MHILLLSPDYPDDRCVRFAFVKQLVDELARLGHHMFVVAPYSLTRNKRFYKKVERSTVGKGVIIVYRPRYISLSNIHIGSYSPSEWCLNYAFRKGIKMVREEVDVVYGHFWTSAYQGYRYAKQHRKSLFVATGESEIDFVCDSEDKKAFCNYVSGVVCVSTKNQEESIKKTLTVKEKCVIIPNAIDSKIFRELGKEECRRRLGLPLNAFIVAFVGWFVERKGANRVSEAISSIEGGKTVSSVFIGDGETGPSCDNILFKGRLLHEKIPEYLNAADIFVLPTLQEGCCNAVIEAMACGLPVVSSNMSFNWDILDETNSIMIDPMNIIDIAEAIRKLRDDTTLRQRLSEGALRKAASMTIDKRASRIIEFIEERK